MTSMASDSYSSNDTPAVVIGILIPISCLLLISVLIIIVIIVRVYCIKKKQIPAPADEEIKR